jgi:hypothetical protein
MGMAGSDVDVVRHILDQAALVLGDGDLVAVAGSYSTMRAIAAGLYRPDLADEEPILTFDPTRG